jgi:hypothetical protein
VWIEGLMQVKAMFAFHRRKHLKMYVCRTESCAFHSFTQNQFLVSEHMFLESVGPRTALDRQCTDTTRKQRSFRHGSETEFSANMNETPHDGLPFREFSGEVSLRYKKNKFWEELIDYVP